MKVLHFVNHSLPVADGYSIRTRYLVHGQQRLGLDPAIVTRPGFANQCPTELNFRQTLDGIPHFHFVESDYPLVRAARRLPRAQRYIERRYATSWYRRVVKECAPCSVFHVHMLPGQVRRLLPLSRQLQVPLIYEVRGVWEDTEVACGRLSEDSAIYKRRRDASTQAAKDADFVITISEGLRRDLVSRGVPANKISVVPNGVDTSAFTPRARDAKLGAQLGLSDQVVIGYISSIRQLEGLDFLIWAMPTILESVPNCICLIVGDGDYMSELRALVKACGLENKIILTGRVRHEDVLAYYSLIDIFVVPRTNNRVNNLVTPLKPLEAMSMAKALLVSGVAGLTELVEDGRTGMVFRSEDAGDLASKAILLARNSELRADLGEAARRHVVQSRDWTKLAQPYPEKHTGASDAGEALRSIKLNN